MTQEHFDPQDLEPRPFQPPSRRRVFVILAILLTLVLLAVLPPLVSMDRFRRQVASSISASLGRPVHLDTITLTMLPAPGFTIENLVVNEDPAFGNEPVIRANQVRARLRFSSLWRRHVEFSRITFLDPSINLVHLPDGRWNLQSILLQASRVQVAPTTQHTFGYIARFPYIEATGARINLKMGPRNDQVKMPFSLTDATLALWLPEPEKWHVRLEAHPTRTDTASTDTGLIHLEGTLGKAGKLEDVPLDLTTTWSAAPLGAVSWVLLGKDAGLRGDLSLTAALHGTIGVNTLESHLNVARLRRADFVPDHPLELDLTCSAQSTNIFHTLSQIRCASPTANHPAANQPALVNQAIPSSNDPAERTQPVLPAGFVLTASIPELLHPQTATAQATLNELPAATLLDALRVVSPRLSPTLAASGSVAASITCCAPTGPSLLTAHLVVTNPGLTLGSTTFIGTPPPAAPSGATPDTLAADLTADLLNAAHPQAGQQATELAVHPILLDLGAPTSATLEARITPSGYTLHLTGSALRGQLLALAQALPSFGDGLAEIFPPAPENDTKNVENGTKNTPEMPAIPLKLDLTSTRSWGSGQVWTQATTPRPTPHRKPARRR